MDKTTPKARMKAEAKAQTQAKTQAKKTRKKVITITLLSFLLIGIFSPLYQTIALAELEEGIYEVQDILAKDFDGIPRKHPQTYAEALKYYNEWDKTGGVYGRTGWSLKLFSCNNENMTETADGRPTPWHEVGYAFTSDSGKDKIYKVEDYENQIRSKLIGKYNYSISKANLIIDEAKKRGVTLKYQEGSKVANEQDFPNGTYEDLPLPCNTGNVGFWYNDQDFKLEFGFEHTKEPEIPKEDPKCTPGTPSLEILPKKRTIEVGQTAQYRAYYNDGTCVQQDVTGQTELSALTDTRIAAEPQAKFFKSQDIETAIEPLETKPNTFTVIKDNKQYDIPLGDAEFNNYDKKTNELYIQVGDEVHVYSLNEIDLDTLNEQHILPSRILSE